MPQCPRSRPRKQQSLELAWPESWLRDAAETKSRLWLSFLIWKDLPPGVGGCEVTKQGRLGAPSCMEHSRRQHHLELRVGQGPGPKYT